MPTKSSDTRNSLRQDTVSVPPLQMESRFQDSFRHPRYKAEVKGKKPCRKRDLSEQKKPGPVKGRASPVTPAGRGPSTILLPLHGAHLPTNNPLPAHQQPLHRGQFSSVYPLNGFGLPLNNCNHTKRFSLAAKHLFLRSSAHSLPPSRRKSFALISVTKRFSPPCVSYTR